MIIDAHHHLWEDLTRRDYGWLAGLGAIRRPYTVDDLAEVTPADRTILVQTVPTVEETEEFLATAAATPLIAGVVGWLDLTTPDVADRIAALREAPGGDTLVGIRHPAQGEADPDWLRRPDVVRGVRAVAEAGLTFDVLVLPPQHQAAIALADAVPGARLVLDHAGKPAIAAGGYAPWAGFLTELAARPNVFCKLSGLVTEADWTKWTVEDLRPYAAHVLTSFGPDRVMFGSDWPVCELAATYAQVYGSARTVTSDLSPSEQDEVFGGTATRAYPISGHVA
ncbi:L-fuconolactonase [Actinophytocola algeriensis]|uniref:L-fuconolactonase n=1 Tax=Actinophytocola algeriensis TaxID=1768010 RepID=A0A7W7VEX9_9PSEU|nr:L-fuconolactonase [Actinophytocola algeriensis]MBE1479756.1 L-fuconolactonase [Actinophytocola algeriensis]